MIGWVPVFCGSDGVGVRVFVVSEYSHFYCGRIKCEACNVMSWEKYMGMRILKLISTNFICSLVVLTGCLGDYNDSYIIYVL